jgi:hypothetical protein
MWLEGIAGLCRCHLVLQCHCDITEIHWVMLQAKEPCAQLHCRRRAAPTCNMQVDTVDKIERC